MDRQANSLRRVPEEREQVAGSIPGDGRAQSPSGKRDHEALGEVLADQPPTAAANRGANGELLPARVDFRHHQSGNIQTAQQQHNPHQPLHQVKRRRIDPAEESG